MRAIAAAACAAALAGIAACGGSSPPVHAAASHSASARPSASSSFASPSSTRSRSASDITGKWTGSCNFPGLQFQDMQLNPDNTAVVGGSETAWAIIETRNPGQAPVDELDMNLPDPVSFVFKVVHGNLLDLRYQGQRCTLSAAGP